MFTSIQQRHPTCLIFVAFAIIICGWAFNWVVMKWALQSIPPYWFTVLRLVLGIVTVVTIQLCTGYFRLPKKQDIPLIISVGCLQIGIYFCLVSEALRFIDAGRSAVLAYTTPLWVVPLAVIFFREHFNWLKLLGLLLGMLGVLALFNPASFNWHSSSNILGNTFLLLAAICMAIATLHIRYGKWHTSAISLFSWQLLAALLPALLFALYFEPLKEVHIHWNITLVLLLLYSTLISLVLCYWLNLFIVRNLSATASSLGTLTVPIVGLFFCSVFLHEKITLPLIIATILIIIGLVLVALSTNYFTRRAHQTRK